MPGPPTDARLAALLAPLANHERMRAAQTGWSLATMQDRIRRGVCATPRPALQVGGSKGKGTTVAYLEALAGAAGRSTGAYTSPHVVSLRERIRIDRQPAAEAELAAVLEPVLADPGARAGELTWFEALTIAAANLFAARRVELSLFEVGLGGRLDATTALPVDGSIVTGIELEHVDLLGDSIAAIAAEKAPVIRRGMPAWTAARGEALEVLSRHAAAVGAPLAVFGRDFGLELGVERAGEYRGSWWSGARREPFRLVGGARVELQALALAAAALDRLFPGIDLRLDPVSRPALPARFEIVERPDGPLVLDGAHTEESLGAVAGELARRFPGHRWRALLASAAGKRWRAGFSRLLPLVDSVAVTAVTGTTSEDPWAIAGWLREQGVPAEVCEDPDAAIRALLATAGPRLVTGSFYLVGRVHAELATSMGTTNA